MHGVGYALEVPRDDRHGAGRGALVDLLPRPLDPVRSVKLKISILLLASGAAGLGYL